MRLLVTGGCGFLGSTFIRYVLQHYGPEWVSNVDNLSTGRLANVTGLAEEMGDRYEFLHADVAEGEKIEALLFKHQFFAVVHFAGEACGAEKTTALLDRARHHGVRRVVVVSTDPPGSALGAAESAALAAHRNYGQEVVISRTPAAFGPFQPATGLVAGTIIDALRGQPISVPGDGTTTREWLQVEDHCSAIFAALLDGRPGSIHHFTTGRKVRDLDVVDLILDHLGKSRDLVRLGPPVAVEAVAVEAPDAEPLAWKPLHRMEQSLRETVDWYVRNREWWEVEPAV